MKRYLFILLALAACSGQPGTLREKISLAGDWEFRIDSLDKGIDEEWYNKKLDETVKLPGSMAGNNKGNDITVNTPWVGDIVDKSYFTDERYEKYRQPGNIKIPFWLTPVKYYKGVAWYRKEFKLPSGFSGKNVILTLERCHWESVVYVNGKKAGSDHSLATPHRYEISEYLNEGTNVIAVRIDNSVLIPIGVNSHSISDHTQSNWNGITGEISLTAVPAVRIEQVAVYPDLQTGKVKVVTTIINRSGNRFSGKVILKADPSGANKGSAGSKTLKASTKSDRMELIAEIDMGNRYGKWSEFSPDLYAMTAILKDSIGVITDTLSAQFGMREFKPAGTRFTVNGLPVFLRGTTECCIFPLTGYPPSDLESWIKVLSVVKDYGMNHVRFHSFCPPEAAFVAADRLGIYFHIECSSWANQGAAIGNGGEVDRFIYEEGDRIIREYGNHPSFVMFAYGNEPAGRNQAAFLGGLINYWKSKDNRRVYTSAAGWPVIPENDYNLIPAPRIQQWGQGLKSVINREQGQTVFDFNDIIAKYTVPVVSHEIGQWCVYPDFTEIEKYTGVLKPTNFEIFRETLEENGMGSQSADFLNASGKLQVLCYKADIEAALRTRGFAGFEILQLHDFPGQGTALVGILNPFFGSKGYVTPEEFRMFCNNIVPLARLEKMVYRNGETFKADVELANFDGKIIKEAELICQLVNARDEIIRKEILTIDNAGIDNCISAGQFETDLKGFEKAEKLRFEIILSGTEYKNSWDIWVYPSQNKPDEGKVYVTESFDSKAEKILNEGGSVLYLSYGKIGSKSGSQVAIGFSSIFWNTAWTRNQAPHTLGILCDPAHALFSDFPTEYHSNWQWWDPVAHSQAMILRDFPGAYKPLIQPIDTWFENRKLALAFEGRCGNGKILVCSIDMKTDMDSRPVTAQLYESVLTYMNSSKFNPSETISPTLVRSLSN